MNKYVAFLRGINVGGNKLIRMADLREVLERAGFSNVRTYIQTGNVIFETDQTPIKAITSAIERALLNAFGFDVKAIVQTVAELEQVVLLDPFKEIEDSDEIRMYVTFHSPTVDRRCESPPSFPAARVEIVARRKQTLFLLCRRKPNGQFEFPNNLFEKDLKVSATTRNWTTVRKTLELARKP